MRRIGKRFPWLVLLSLLIPTIAGYVLSGFTWRVRCAGTSGAASYGSSSCTT